MRRYRGGSFIDIAHGSEDRRLGGGPFAVGRAMDLTHPTVAEISYDPDEVRGVRADKGRLPAISALN
jgi:hypothetical protein